MKNRIRLILSFIVFEIKETLKLFLAISKRALVISSTLMFTTLLLLIITDKVSKTQSSSTFLSIIFEILVITGISIVYSLPIALTAGFVRVVWRQCGIMTLVPVILIPTATILILYLFSEFLIGEAKEVFISLAASAKTHGLQHTSSRMDVAGVHAGALAIIILVLALPFVLFDIIIIFTDINFLLQFLWFIVCFIVIASAGILPSTLVSIILLCIAFIKRLIHRFSEFASEYELPAH